MIFCEGHLIQDGRQTAIYGRNLFWAITWYLNVILTSNFVCWHLKIKTYNFFCQGHPIKDIWSKPILGHNLVLD